MPLSRDDLRMIDNSLETYLRHHYDDGERRRIYDSTEGWSAKHWRAMADGLGLLGAGLPEDVGGFGGGAAAHALIMQRLGSALFLEPYLSTAVIGAGFLRHGTHAAAADLMAGIVAGQVRMAYAHGEPETRYNLAHVGTRARRRGGDYVLDGRKAVVLGGPGATHIIVVARVSGDVRDREGISLFLLEADRPGITRRDYRTLSGMPASEIMLSGVMAFGRDLLCADGAALPLTARVVDEATVAICAEAVGVMTRLHADTLAYTQQRSQFGRALSSYQVLQHRMVDMLMMATHSKSLVARAVEALESSDLERTKLVSAAKVYVGKAARFCGQQAIQLHGGIGMTDELPVGFYFKRAVEIERQFGAIDHHLTRYARAAYTQPVAG